MAVLYRSEGYRAQVHFFFLRLLSLGQGALRPIFCTLTGPFLPVDFTPLPGTAASPLGYATWVRCMGCSVRISTVSSMRTASSLMLSIISSNISKPSMRYSITGSRWP